MSRTFAKPAAMTTSRCGLVTLLLVGSACGGAEPPPESPPPRQTAAPAATASSGIDPFATLRERLPECADVELADVLSNSVDPRCREAVTRLLEDCETSDLDALQASNDISDECRATLYELLPSEGRVGGRLLHLGTERDADMARLYVAATDAEGRGRSLSAGELRVVATMEDGSEVALEGISVAPVESCESPALAMSSILDYSASMRQEDIEDATTLFRTLYAAVPAGCLESDAIFFSATVDRRAGFSSSVEEMRAAMSWDPSYRRASTALFDAMGLGLEGLSEREAPARLLVVATDGRENASGRWGEAELVAAARQNGARIVVLGSLLSDVDAMGDLAAQSGGLFLYRPRLSDLREEVDRLGDALAHLQSVTVRDPRAVSAQRISVTVP